jgi:hypothetical protein
MVSRVSVHWLQNSNPTLQENDAKITGWSSNISLQNWPAGWAIIQTSFFIIEFTCNFRRFYQFSSAVAGLAEVFMPGQTVISILL